MTTYAVTLANGRTVLIEAVGVYAAGCIARDKYGSFVRRIVEAIP